MTTDITIRVTFLTQSEGGRSTALSGSVYHCPLLVDGAAFDCRISLEGRRLELGSTYDLPVKFMNPANALRLLKPGAPISLWEGRTIAIGTVLSSHTIPR